MVLGIVLGKYRGCYTTQEYYVGEKESYKIKVCKNILINKYHKYEATDLENLFKLPTAGCCPILQ